MGKGKNAGYQHFLLFPQCCEKASVQVIKTWHCLVDDLTLSQTRPGFYVSACWLVVLGFNLALFSKWFNPFPNKTWFLCVCLLVGCIGV